MTPETAYGGQVSSADCSGSIRDRMPTVRLPSYAHLPADTPCRASHAIHARDGRSCVEVDRVPTGLQCGAERHGTSSVSVFDFSTSLAVACTATLVVAATGAVPSVNAPD
jgi:hypothetical protein